ncbi:glycosyltransferase [Marinitoga litoralis]|uniref:glycosyltransferase n=1 Tax=Marinitoga litoralis TaxID=570855 RepID=UPI001960B2B6|nr:glycosyltransferase [Marinitoga litoralis]MBM7560309.1 glycosyltransferase involved in cell wall biosynthesis [Marinitoga litoralis]
MDLKKIFDERNFERVIKEFNNKKVKEENDYIITALAYYNLKETNKAISILKEVLKLNPNNLDALFNLSTIYYNKKNWNKLKDTAIKYYEKDPNDWAINDMLADLWLFEGHFDQAISFLEKAFNNAPQGSESYFKNKINNFKNKFENAKKLPKLSFICAKGLDNFINDIIEGLSNEYWVRKFVVTKNEEIYQAIDWADIVWLEWANEVAIVASNYNKLSGKPAIIRLHSYESLAYYPTKINWNNIDKLILVAEHIKDIIKSYIPNIENLVDIEIIPNGVKINNIPFSKREKGYNIAWVANISHKKNPPMMLQIIKKLVEKDNRYKLHIAGDFQELRYQIYLKHMVKEMNLENNVIFYGWVDDMDEWWKDKNYLLSTSIHESFGYNIAEAMAKGIKPIIHNFFGSKNIWPKDLLFNTIDDAVKLIIEERYETDKYREYVKNNYSFDEKINELKNTIKKYKYKSCKKK